jgi:hypothetical protein
VSNSVSTIRQGYYREVRGSNRNDADLKPFASLFLKPLTQNKSVFSKKELELMCKDPMHSPRLILYLIDFIKGM